MSDYRGKRGAEDWLLRRVRVWSAQGRGTAVLAEGVVVGYAPAPTILVRSDDGSQSDWQVSLPIDVLAEEALPADRRAAAPGVAAVLALHQPYEVRAVPVGPPPLLPVCRECSAPEDWDDPDGPYLHPTVHLVSWPCATVEALAGVREGL